MKKTIFAIFCIAFAFQSAFLMGEGIRDTDSLPTVTGGGVFREPQPPTLEDEYYLGRAVAANILAAYKPYTQNQALTLYLNRILQVLVINSERPVIFNGYHLMILDSPEYNAFATPGGHIFITRAMVEAAPSEDALAGVIAHELAHIILRHCMGIIDNIRVEDDLSAIAQNSATVAGGQRIAYFRRSIMETVDIMVKNGYSRPQEFEADSTAVVLLASAGYDPGGLHEMLKVLNAVRYELAGALNSTHPTPAERVANIETLRFRANNTRSFRVPRFNAK